MRRFSTETLGQIIQDKEKMDFHQMLSKYIPLFSQDYGVDFFVRNHNLQTKLMESEKENGALTKEEVKSLFNQLLFRAMPINLMDESELMDSFISQLSENENQDFEEFTNFYQEWKKVKKEERMFHDVSDEVQIRLIEKSPNELFHQYLNQASKKVQNEKFLELFEKDPDIVWRFYSFPYEIYRKNEKLIIDYIDRELQDKIELQDILGTKETLRRCSATLFKHLPDEMKYDVIDEFTKAELEIIKNENVPWEEIEETLTGEELLEILDLGYFEQKEGEVFHLAFDTVQPDVGKLIKVAKKYKLSCDLTVESCADLSMKTIQSLNALGIEIEAVRFKKEELSDEQQQPYDIETYKKCLAVIDIMTRDIEEAAFVKQNDPDRDKKVCGTVTRRLANFTRYNNDYIHRSDYGQVTEQEDIENRNLVGALLNGECVCAGYAEATRNLLACCQIEACYIGADNKKIGKDGHAWNQAKLDGEWTNLDVTWDADRIVKEEEPKYCFKSDEEFGHKQFIPRGIPHKCERTITNVKKYMNYAKMEQNITFSRLLRKGIKNCEITFSEVSHYEGEKNRKIAGKEK